MYDDLSDEELTQQVLKKLETAEKYRKMNEILDRSADTLEQFSASSADEDAIAAIKDKLNQGKNE